MLKKNFLKKRNNRPIYNANVKIDFESHTKMLTGQKINVGWERFRVSDGTYIMKCLNVKVTR